MEQDHIIKTGYVSNDVVKEGANLGPLTESSKPEIHLLKDATVVKEGANPGPLTESPKPEIHLLKGATVVREGSNPGPLTESPNPEIHLLEDATVVREGANPGPLTEFSNPEIHLLKDATVHSMPSESLRRYLEMKIHEGIEEELNSGKWQEVRIIVNGSCNWRSHEKQISKLEKPGKLGNWMRPTLTTATIDDPGQQCNSIMQLTLHVFPGHDYVYHYACIVKNYIKLFWRQNIATLKPIITVDYQMPTERECVQAIRDCGIRHAVADGSLQVKNSLCVIGVVDRLTGDLGNEMTNLFEKQHIKKTIDWTHRTFFCWREGNVGGKKVVLLCVKFSIWGDIGGRLVQELGELGSRQVVYTGKVGGLHEDMVPNSIFATGITSFVRESPHTGKIIWQNAVSDALLRQIGKYRKSLQAMVHYNSPSILLEDKLWISSLKKDEKKMKVDIVDPEIGSMALAAKRANVEFGYLHLVSDNLVKKYDADLSNERIKTSVDERKKAYSQLVQILAAVITDI